ncbi:MAG: hypothetical protein PWQ55_2206 [Chloroflexota bacterium]|nr:hypothetical protein [Chloroflexota bacterium]
MAAAIALGRADFDKILHAGIKTAEFNFLENLLDLWFEKYPNDLAARYQLATVKHLKTEDAAASKILEDLLVSDPEMVAAYNLLIKLNIRENKKALNSAIHVLTGRMDDIETIYPWAVTLRAVRQGIRKKEYAHSEKLLRKIISSEQENLLAVVEHCRLSSLVDESQTLLQLTEIYHKRWPNCLQVDLWRAKALFETGREADAVSLLHSCVGRDPAGMVADRMWGSGHEFSSLWPKLQSIDLTIQVPSSIAVSLNWNQLNAGELEGAKTVSSHRPGSHRPQGKYEASAGAEVPSGKSTGKGSSKLTPVYVVLSTRLGLEAKYGSKTTDVIVQKMTELAETVKQKAVWQAMVFLPDDFTYTDPWGLTNIGAVDPWKIKLALSDLDKALKDKGLMVGAVLIVGCHEIVPFHKLPNPTDDSDEEVLSDNPYATTSGNYLSPEWPVGRFPGEKGNDAGLILEQLRHAIEFQKSTLNTSSFLSQAFSVLTGRISPANLLRDLVKKPRDFGYSASVWRRSSMAAFRPIGTGSDLRVCPQFDSDTIDVDNLMKAKCAYFNLHGMATTPEWYGQRDYSEDDDGPDFPVAIAVENLPNMTNNIDLVISEACYGGYIIDKTIDDSMALKLISIGSQGMVASTCISYGSVYTPLIGADLFAFILWKYTKDGSSFGEAFMQAKLGLIDVMTQRQGYLDGEDQKTLLSFVLYGDPLGYLEANVDMEKGIARGEKRVEVKAIADQDGALAKAPRISKETAANLNEMMATYLPSLDSASMKVREHQVRIAKVIQSSGKGEPSESSSEFALRTQVMYSQKTRVAHNVHEQFARVTLDEAGKVIKLAVSR